MAKVNYSQSEKDILLLSLDGAIASNKRLINRPNQNPLITDIYRKEGEGLANLRLKVASMDVL